MYLVVGLGITGQSVLRYFQAQGEPCLAYDTRADLDVSHLVETFTDVEFATGEMPNNWIKKIETVVLSPGVSCNEPWVANLRKLGKQIVGDIELFCRAVGVPVIGITGSNGKSTVTTLVGSALQEAGYITAMGGNLGEPALDLLMDGNEYDVYVIELSSFQLETTYSLQTISSTVLNISEDHMDRYDVVEAYIQAKTKVFENTELAVIPEGFSVEGMIHNSPVARFGLSDCVIQSERDYGLLYQDGETWLARGTTPLVRVSDMALQGKHHQLNALAMMALCEPFKVSNTVFTKVLRTFKGLPHRTQLLVNYKEVDWINDSKGTNVGATLTALKSIGEQALNLQGRVVLIAGGVGKEADFSALQPAVNQYCRHVIVFGRDQQLIASVLPTEPVSHVETLQQAVALADTLAQPSDKVLFSPACASFDQFANYVQRGEAFEKYVGELIDSQELV